MMKMWLALVLSAVAVSCWARPSQLDDAQYGGYDRSLRVVPTVGSPWPMPDTYVSTPDIQTIDMFSFQFNAIGQSCDILQSAFSRYYNIIFRGGHPNGLVGKRQRRNALKFRPKFAASAAPVVSALNVKVQNPCEHYPSLEMDESYTLDIASGVAVLNSLSIWGALRGLETFSQLVTPTIDMGFILNTTHISDMPRFAWRGILLDTARHFLPLDTLLQNIDAMAYTKFNVFHWHIVDDQSFPYQSRDFPEMSKMGAYNPYTHVYTQADVHTVIEHARMRGIRVVPEFDSPGHSLSWGHGIPGLVTPCCDSTGKPNGAYGPVNPILDSTYKFTTAFVKELTEVFSDRYLHLGGDEVSFDCWKSNPNITAFMKDKGFGTDYAKLESYYIQNLLNIVDSYKAFSVVWQEVFDNNVTVHPNTVIEVWKSDLKEVAAVTAKGLRAIYSSSWYLDYISYGSDWVNYYKVDPSNFTGTPQQKALLIGGEACLWAEMVDATNVESRLWPRASAVAERLWSPETVTSVNSAMPRMEEHRCRLVRRGINAEPASGPGFCAIEASTL